MSKRSVYHVTPDPDGGWNLKQTGNQRASGHFDHKDDAVDRGRELARNAEPGQLVIHGTDGKIQTEHTYGNDPYPPKG